MSQRDTNTKSTTPKLDIISRTDWDQRLVDAPIAKHDLNSIVLNFLIIEGYKDAAQQFCMEANLKPIINFNSIHERMLIRTDIHNGFIDQAIDRINELDPDILESNPQLFFHLQQQRLIELIRHGNITAALDFAQTELAPRGEENPMFLEELERTLVLLVFDQSVNSSVAELFHMSQRQKTAREVNSAILLSQSQEKDPKLPSLIKCMLWAQSQLSDVAIFPKIDDPVTGKFYIPSQCETTDINAMQL